MDNYKLSFLPQFSEDLNQAVEYISNVLMNPIAAYNLIDDIETAINERLNHSPEAFEQYPSKKTKTVSVLQDLYQRLHSLLCCDPHQGRSRDGSQAIVE